MKKKKTLYVWEMSGGYAGGIAILPSKNKIPDGLSLYNMEYAGTLKQWLKKSVMPSIQKRGFYNNSYITATQNKERGKYENI